MIINDKLCTVKPTDSVMESQKFDSLVTQQWLRVSMWRLAFGARPFSHARGDMLPFFLPVDAAKSVMKALDSVSQASKDAHGIAIVSTISTRYSRARQ